MTTFSLSGEITRTPRPFICSKKPRTAQALARHSDIRLTMGVYTHIGLEDQALAIEALPAPPPLANSGANGKAGKSGANGGTSGHTGENGGQEMVPKKVPKKVPSGAENGAVRLASETYQPASSCTVWERFALAKTESTPDRIRTCNPRFRRPCTHRRNIQI